MSADDGAIETWNALLLEAIEAEDRSLVCEALAGGADARMPCGEWGFVAAAAMTKNLDVLRTVLAAGGNPNERALPASAFAGSTSLYWGASGGSLEIIRALIDAGARVEEERPEEGRTSVHAAAERGFVEVLRLLLERAGGRVALNAFDYLSRTPLICAVQENHIEATELLISAGADVNACDSDRLGKTALGEAVVASPIEMVELLLRAGADPRMIGSRGAAAFRVAANRQGPSGEQIRKLLNDSRDR